MLLKSTALPLATLISVCASLALPQGDKPCTEGTEGTEITPELLTQIAPKTASCAGAEFPGECADASRAAIAISNSFTKYDVKTNGQKAALIAIMLFESADFQYNKNHFPVPGNPGQGTKNMQSPDYNLEYAQSLFDPVVVSSAQAQGPDAVLQLVSGDGESFGSAAWFMASQCSDAVKQGLTAGTAEGWKAYLVDCVQTTDTEDRDAGWRNVTAVIVP